MIELRQPDNRDCLGIAAQAIYESLVGGILRAPVWFDLTEVGRGPYVAAARACLNSTLPASDGVVTAMRSVKGEIHRDDWLIWWPPRKATFEAAIRSITNAEES